MTCARWEQWREMLDRQCTRLRRQRRSVHLQCSGCGPQELRASVCVTMIGLVLYSMGRGHNKQRRLFP